MKKREDVVKLKGGLAFKIVVATILALYSLCLFILLYLTLMTSLKSIPDYNSNPIGIPKSFEFSNYVTAFKTFKVDVLNGTYTVYLYEMFLYSVLYAGGCTIAATLVPCIVAYLCAKFDVWLNKFIYGAVIVAMILPIVGSLPSSIQMTKWLGIYNTIWGQFIMKASFTSTYFLIFYATFKSLSNEYREAAIIDGASQTVVLIKIVLPLVKSTIYAIAILNFIGYWNDYQAPLVYMRDWPTAAVGLFEYVYSPSSNSVSTTNMQMAGCMLLFIPMFALFIAFKDVFMGNLTVGGLKG